MWLDEAVLVSSVIAAIVMYFSLNLVSMLAHGRSFATVRY
jgi:hypothetical protein